MKREENNIGTETTIEMSLRLLGGMEKSELMDTLESEEDREKKRKLDEVSEGKLTRPGEDALFLRKEIIDALKRSEEKKDEKMEKFSAENHGFSRNTAPRDELIHCENERRRRQIQAIQ